MIITTQATPDIQISIFSTIQKAKEYADKHAPTNHILHSLDVNSGYCPRTSCEDCPLYPFPLSCGGKETTSHILTTYFPDFAEKHPEYLL